MDAPRRRRRAEAAEYLRLQWEMQVSSATLANYAVNGNGPIYCLIGKYAFYDDPDLDSWAQSRITPAKRKASANLVVEIASSDVGVDHGEGMSYEPAGGAPTAIEKAVSGASGDEGLSKDVKAPRAAWTGAPIKKSPRQICVSAAKIKIRWRCLYTFCRPVRKGK
jgi:hypothetical protein